jgi:hypothetical protein
MVQSPESKDNGFAGADNVRKQLEFLRQAQAAQHQTQHNQVSLAQYQFNLQVAGQKTALCRVLRWLLPKRCHRIGIWTRRIQLLQ